MMAFDVSINEISLFSFVLAIGIVVDDAIVVGRAHSIRTQSGNARCYGRDPRCTTDQGAVDLRGPYFGGGFRPRCCSFPAASVTYGGHCRSHDRHASGLAGRIAAGAAQPLVPFEGSEWVPTNAFDRFFARLQGRVDRQLNSSSKARWIGPAVRHRPAPR